MKKKSEREGGRERTGGQREREDIERMKGRTGIER